jgi:hypothetical protein
MIRIVLLALGSTLVAGPALAQDGQGLGTTSRGRAGSDAFVVEAAQRALAGADVDCRVTEAVSRGRDTNGDTHYEAACADAPGYVVIASPQPQAFSCLAFDASGGPLSGTSCRLPENRDARRHYARMAAHAGVTCEVEEGRLIGMTPAGHMLYELGCRRAAGVWLEQFDGGWKVTDCLTVASQGGQCRLTSDAEARGAFAMRLEGTELSACALTDVRAMGRGADGDYFEVLCAGGPHIVTRFDVDQRLAEVIPCAEARKIGSGCRYNPEDIRP